MKRLLTRCLVMTLLIVSGITTAMAQKSVLDESFASGSLPTGWTAGEYWDFQDGNAKFAAPFENGADTLVTPLLSLSALENKPSVAITYSLVANGEKVNTLKLLYRTSASGDWSELKAFNAATEGNVYWKDALPDGMEQVQIAIAGAYLLGGETRVYRLAVENKTEAADAPTGLKYEDLTSTGVTLWWDVCISPMFQQYNVKVNSSQMTDMSAEGDVINYVNVAYTDEFLELSELNPNQEYWLYVQYDCGDGDVSPWAELSFRTPCEAITGTFAENFEGAISTCYTIIKGGAAAEVSGEYAYNSQKAFKSNSVKGKYNYLILPEFTGDVKNFQVSFMAAAADAGNTYARTVTVGVCTDATAESFTEVKTLDLPKGRTWEQIVVTLKGYKGAGKYIAFRFGNEDRENRIFIDNIQIQKASECPKPMFLVAYEINPTSAKLKWIETGNANEWNLVLSTKPLVDPEDIEPDAAKGEFAGSISQNPYQASNLLPNTTYFAYVQAGCGSSEWTSAVEFKTARAVTYPYSEHFDRMDPDSYDETTTNAIPSGWVMDDRCITSGSNYDKQYSSATYRPYVTTKENHEQTAYVNAALKLTGASSTGYMSIAMLPAMPKAVNTMMVTFWAKAANGNQTLKVGVANTQTNDLAQGKQLGENITEVGQATIIKDEWKQYKVLLTNYTGDGRYITLAIGSPYSGTPTIYIDDIVVDDAPDCNAVSTLSATATGIDKATVEWTDASSSTSWVINVSSSEIDPETTNGDIVAAQTVTAKSYDITGLSMGQKYYIYVSPTCGDAWLSTSVTTLVGLQVPYYNDFTGETTGYVANRGPKNWTLGNTSMDTWTTSSYVPYLYNSNFSNSPADATKPYLYLPYTTTASSQFPYAIMPELLNADVKDLKISFYGYYNSTSTSANYAGQAGGPFGQLHIGVVSSPTDINKTNKFTKVTHVATVRCAKGQTAEQFIVDMSGYTGTGKYIVFYCDTAKYNYFGIDNLSITLASAPQPVSGVAASEITQAGAKLTWTENGKATKWQVRVFDAAQADPAAGEPAFSATVETTAEATVTGLKPSTNYYAYVRSVQGEEFGAWGGTSFRTECGVYAVPYTEDWNNFATGTTSLDASCYTYTAGAKIGGSSAPSASPKTGNCIQLNATSTNSNPMVVFPEFDKPIKTLQLTMVGSSYTATYVGVQSYLEVGVLEAGDSFVIIGTYQQSVYNQWEEYFVNFSSYTGEGGRIAMRAPRAVNGKDINMCYDNVVIEQIPQCGRITTINVTEIDSVSAKIAWEKGKTENKWNLKVSTTELEDPSAATADVFDGALTEQSKTLTDLEGNTTYYVYVQSVDETLECTGQWSNAKTFKTTCKKQTFPYEEDWESYETGSGKDLGCNTLCGPDKNHSYVTTKNSTKMLYLRQATKGNHNYFVFPALSVDSVKRLQLSMQVYSGGTTATTKYAFEVGIMTDPNDPSTFVATHKDTVMGSSTPYDRSYTFEGYAGDESGLNFGTFIALKAMESTAANGNTSAGYVYVDNVYIDFIETCPAATDLKTDSIGIYGAKFSWLTNDKTIPHRVRIFDDPSIKPNNEGWIAEAVVSDTNSVVIEGLNSLTTYYAYVRKECSESDMSKWSSAYQFKTECPAFREIPYEEGFEGTTDPLADYCWASLMVQHTSGCTTDYNAKSSTSAKKDGNRGLYLQFSEVPSQAGGSCVGTHRSAAITPVLDVENLNELLLYFDVKSSSTTKAGVKIEAVSDETISADAIYITTINDLDNNWQKAYIKLGDYYTSVQPYKRLRFTSTTATSVYIDNMVFTKDLNVVLPVENLKLQMLTENSIKFSFVEQTPGVNQWQVAYVAAGGDFADATVLTIDATEYTITGLNTNTSYDIYVRGNVEGDAWVGPLTATTIQAPAPLPLITGFEDAEDNAMWNIYNVQKEDESGIHFYPNFWIVGKADSCAGTGENALFITNDSASYIAFDKNDGTNMDPVKYAYQGSNIVATSYVWATRNIKIEAAGTYKFSFKYKVPKCYSSDGLYAQLIPAGATFKAGTATLISGATRSGSATTATDANGCYLVMGKQDNVADWTWFKQSLDIEEPGIYTLALYWYNPSAGEPYATPAAIDSVIVEEYLCTTPKNIEFVARKANEVTLSWFGGKCKNFEYVLSRYAKLGNPSLIDAEDKEAFGTLSEGPQVTIAGLMPSTKYSFYVRTICEDGLTDWVEYDFDTPCELFELPYTEGFFETPECWVLSGASVGTTTVGTSASNEKWNRLLLNANTGMAILPELAVDLKNVEVEIGLFNTTANYGAVSLGVMDNTWDASTFKEVAQFQTQTKPANTGTYTPTQLEVFNKMLNLYKGTGKVLAIKNATANAIGVKYITLTELPDCVKPQQVELTFLTENAVTVNWLAGVEEAWEIQLNDSIIKNVTTNPYRIEGLEQGTVYTVAVRALCDEESTSEWSLPATFQTSCGVNPLPLFEDFSGLTASNSRATMTCWSNMATDQPIESVFNGSASPYEPLSNVYYTYMWIANYLEQFGDEHQLLFFGSSLTTSGPKYRWMITPQYAIEGKASLSFDVRHTDNKNCAAQPEGRFFVAISTDNGASWKKADATLIEGIDSVYTTKSVSLDKYAGQNIRVAFYMENLGGTTTSGKGSGIFTLLDNVRMNCSDIYPIADNACQGHEYEGYGFVIKPEDLPIAGEDSTYYRFAANTSEGCDSIVALTITTRKTPEIAPIYDTICQGEVYEFGGQKLTKPNPEGQPYYISGETQYGCDSTIYLYLAVLPADTTNIKVAIENNVLPYYVDDYYTVPADAPIDMPFDTIIKAEDCHFNRYFVTVSRCKDSVAYADMVCEGSRYEGYGFVIEAADLPAAGESKEYIHVDRTAFDCDSTTSLTLTVKPVKQTPLEDNICEDESIYEGYNFVIPKAEWPAVGESQNYFQYLTSAEGCDSIVTLTLTVTKADTTDIHVVVLSDELPKVVDQYYTIPADAPIDEPFDVLLKADGCAYNHYFVTVAQCKDSVGYADKVCAGSTYEGYGFVIEPSQLPDAGESRVFSHVDKTIHGCDSMTTLTLTVMPVKQTMLEADICEDESIYEGYNFSIPKADWPAVGESKDFYQNLLTVEGCDSIVTLTLTVNKADTTELIVEKLNTELPFEVDEYFTIPANTPVGGPYVETVKTGDCAYNRYVVTIVQCTGSEEPADEICENAESYNGYGFTIVKADFPAANTSKEFKREEMIDNCLITYTLTLTVNKADTIDQTPVSVNADKLPYEVDQYYTIPENTPVGGPYVEVIEIADCEYNRYFVTIHDAGFGLMNITDAVEAIEVYDALGRKVATFHQGDVQHSLPNGVYMLRTIMKSGQVVNSKVTLK